MTPKSFRRNDGKEVFYLKKPNQTKKNKTDAQSTDNDENPRHAEYWQDQAYPVMLVIRTSDGQIRWMNVTDYLKQHGRNTTQIIFDGEPFTAANLIRMRDKLLV